MNNLNKYIIIIYSWHDITEKYIFIIFILQEKKIIILKYSGVETPDSVKSTVQEKREILW